MTVIAVAETLIDETNSAVKLARYAQLAQYSEDQFFGLNNPATQQAACQPVWTHAQRAILARYLAEAQEEIEQFVCYPLFPRWFVDEQQYYGFPVHTQWGKVITGGFRNTATIQLAAAVSHATDPAIIGPFATTVTDEDEIALFHPGTDVEIYPSAITLAGGFVTLSVPRARLVKQSYLDNPEDGWTYSDVPPSGTSPFESTVDIKRVYNDDSIQAGLIWPHRTTSDCTCTCLSCCGTCGEYSANGCIYVRNGETGAVDVLEAAHSVETGWTAACPVCYCEDPTLLRLNYKAGLTPLTRQAEDAVIRLAHSKMPMAPCGCGVISEMWTRDRNVPDNMTMEQANCPFGNSAGAYWAWRQANMMMLKRGLALG